MLAAVIGETAAIPGVTALGQRTSSNVDVVLTRSIGGPIMIWSLMRDLFRHRSAGPSERSTRLIEHTLLILPFRR
jgi:hypothetical protein